MTDFGCAPGLHRTYAKRMPKVCGAILLCLLPSASIADAWEAFQGYCLTLLPDGAEATPKDLSLVQDNAALSIYGLEQESFAVQWTVFKPVGLAQSCSVLALDQNSHQDLRAGFRAFEQNALATGAFEYAGHSSELWNALNEGRAARIGLISETSDRELTVNLVNPGNGEPLFVSAEEFRNDS